MRVDSKSKEYRENMEEIGKEIITENKGEREDRWNRLIENIKKGAERVGMTRKQKTKRTGEGGREREFKGRDEEKKLMKNVFKHLKKYLKTKGNREQEDYKVSRRKLKEYRRGRNNRERKQKWEKVKNSKNMGDFWGAIGEFRPKRRCRGNGIKKVQWEKHFMKLLGGQDIKSENPRTHEGLDEIEKTDTEHGETGRRQEEGENQDRKSVV